MKRNFTVNIQGTIFHIDEDAFELLTQYFNSIRNHFAGTDGADEIYQDIEARVAEMLSANTGDQHHVVIIDDVSKVIAAMGQPFEIAGESPKDTQPESGQEGRRKKRLFRDVDNKIIGGVGSGMAAYFNADPIWFRLGFIASFFFAGPLLYIAFWIAMPAAVTTAEKLEMKGEPVNVANIEKSIRDEFNDIADRIKNRTSKSKKKGGREPFRASWVGDGLSALGYVIIRVIAIFIGFILFVIGFSLLFGLLAAAVFPAVSIASYIDAFSISSFMELIFQDKTHAQFAIWGIVLMVGVPALLLMYGGIKMIFNLRYRTPYIGQISGAIFLIGLIFTIFTGVKLAEDFRESASKRDVMVQSPIESKVIYLKAEELDLGTSRMHCEGAWLMDSDDGLSWLQYPEFDIRKSPDDSVRVKIIRSSRGETMTQAFENCKGIIYPFQMTDSSVTLPLAYNLAAGHIWRHPKLKVILEVPDGTILKPDFEIDALVDHGDNWFHFPTGFGGKTCVMSPSRELTLLEPAP